MIYGYERVNTKGQAKDGNSLEEQRENARRWQMPGGLALFVCNGTMRAKALIPLWHIRTVRNCLRNYGGYGMNMKF